MEDDEDGTTDANRRIEKSAEGTAVGDNSRAGNAVDETDTGLERPAHFRDLSRGARESRRSELRSMPATRFQAEVIVGWRAWRLVSWKLLKVHYEVVLESIVYAMIWHPGKAAKAVVGLDLPSGIHAWQTREQCVTHSSLYDEYSRDWITGEVSLWGHVVKHERGYRAEFAYPRSLIVPHCLREHGDIPAALRRTYGIESQWL